MNKLYVVYFKDLFGDSELVGVYNTKDKVNEAIEMCMKEYHAGDYVEKTWESEQIDDKSELIEDEYLIIECELNQNIHAELI
ncbi:hypothetical protein NGB25_12735 [Staphylococcus saprophyticus]|uniref:hypothetical protein n=1 Tax=Staphylococcus saprophyticus TaxID=29385 RepID=UPI002DB5C4D4|nr:hypothetical protein [Staphylococcus saprophyticus]MEB7677966.1 hypothetical protein [Staphylococcus saprophyticus]